MTKLRIGQNTFLEEHGVNEYEAGLLLVAKNVRQMLIWHYFATRLTKKLPTTSPPTLKNLNQMEASEAIRAFHELIAIGIRKLIETRKDSWSFTRLFQQIEKSIDHEASELIKKSIDDFSSRWSDFKDYSDERGVHVSKRQDLSTYHSFANLEQVQMEAIEILDNFVVGKVPYIMEIGDEQIDLRMFITNLGTFRGQ